MKRIKTAILGCMILFISVGVLSCKPVGSRPLGELVFKYYGEIDFFLNGKQLCNNPSDYDLLCNYTGTAILQIQTRDQTEEGIGWISRHYLTYGNWSHDDHLGVSFILYDNGSIDKIAYIVDKSPEEKVKVIEKIIIKEVPKESKSSDKEEKPMTLWQIFLMFVIALIVVKCGHLLTRKVIFKYIKKKAREMKEDWDKCEEETK